MCKKELGIGNKTKTQSYYEIRPVNLLILQQLKFSFLSKKKISILLSEGTENNWGKVSLVNSKKKFRKNRKNSYGFIYIFVQKSVSITVTFSNEFTYFQVVFLILYNFRSKIFQPWPYFSLLVHHDPCIVRKVRLFFIFIFLTVD